MALAITVALALVKPEACLCAAPLLLLWASARTIARWLSIQRINERAGVKSGDEQFLRAAALWTWRYFRENSGASKNCWCRQHSGDPGNSGGSHFANQSGLAAERPSGGAQYGIYHAVGIRQPECAYAIGRCTPGPNTVGTFSIGTT